MVAEERHLVHCGNGARGPLDQHPAKKRNEIECVQDSCARVRGRGQGEPIPSTRCSKLILAERRPLGELAGLQAARKVRLTTPVK